jgi:CHAT domain-containing protein
MTTQRQESPAKRAERRREVIDEGVRLYQAGRPLEAARRLLAALELFGQEERDGEAYARYCSNLGSAWAESGQTKLARDMFGTALTIYRAHGDAYSEAETHFNLGNVARYANHRQAAADHYREALRLAHTLTTPEAANLAATCLLSQANHYLSMGIVAEAQPLLDEFDRLDPAVVQEPTLRWSSLFQRSKIASAAGNRELATSQLEEALALARGLGHAGYVAETQAALAKLNPGARSLDELEAAVEQVRAQRSPDRLDTTFALARAVDRSGDEARADALFAECLEVIEEQRIQHDLAERWHVMESAAPAIGAIVLRLMQRCRPAEAFEASERGQARALLDLMFRHQIRRQGGRRITVGPIGRLALASCTLAELVADLATTGAHLLKLFRAEGRLLAWFAGPAGLIDAWDASAALGPLDRVLAVLLEWNREDDEATRGARPRHVRSPAPPAAADWAALDAALQAFGSALLTPKVSALLGRAGGPLVIVPHLALHQLPFGAIRCGGEPLGERWQIALSPSAGCWLQLDPRRDPPAHLRPRAEGMAAAALVVGDVGAQQVEVELLPGDPGSVLQIEFDDLPGARREALAVQRLCGANALLGPLAAKRSVAMMLPYHRLLHFASHGWWHVLGENSFVVLGSGPGERGARSANALFGRDVMQLTLQAELVVLSACQTGLGGLHPDSYVGLAQSFLVGGARAVLVSLWPVDDDATVALMERFYTALMAGATPAAALQAAQQAIREQPATADGLYWAGWQLVGRPFVALDAAAAGAPCAGPSFAGGDVLRMNAEPGSGFDLGPLAAIEVPAGTGLIVDDRGAHPIGRSELRRP